MSRELLKQCAAALDPFDNKVLLKAIETELAKPEQKPYGWIGELSRAFIKNVGQKTPRGIALYTTTPDQSAPRKLEPEPVAWYCTDDPDPFTAFSWKPGKCSNCGNSLQPLYADPITKPNPEPIAWMSKTFPTTFATSKDIAQPAMFFTPLYAEPVDQPMIAELIAQRTMHEQIIKTAYDRCSELERQLAEQSARKPLTDDGILDLAKGNRHPGSVQKVIEFARAIEAAHGIGVEE